MKTRHLIALAVLAATGAAHADGYYEVDISRATVKGSDAGLTIKANPTVLKLTAGYELHPNLAVEGFYGISSSSDNVRANGVDTALKVEAKSVYGVFLKPQIQLNDRFQLFGRVGYAESKLSAAGRSVSDDDVALGFGVNYLFPNKVYLSTGFTQYYKKDGFKASALHLGIGAKY